jgi:hypothetical protein
LASAGALIALIWFGSYRWEVELRLPAAHRGRAVSVSLYRGLVLFSMIDDAPSSRQVGLTCADGRERLRSVCWDEAYWRTSFAGVSGAETFVWLAGANGRDVSRRCQLMSLPLWAVLAVWCMVALHQLRVAWRINRRLRLGHCPRCGYDLHRMKIECPACIARTTVIDSSPRLQLIH